MPSLGGAIELIGVRAVILDVRNYVAEGKRIEAATDAIGKAQAKLAATSQATAGVIQANNTKLTESFKKINQARAQLTAAEGALKGGLRTGVTSTQEAALLQNVANARKEVIKATENHAKVAQAASAAVVRSTNAEIAANARLKASQEALGAARAARFGTAAKLGAAAGVVAAAATFTASTVAASKYQDSLSKIDNLTNLTTAQTKQMGQEIQRLASVVPKSPDDLGAAAYVILSSGITDLAEAQSILEQSAKAATAGFGDTKEIAIAVTGILKAYGEENISAAQATDILFAAVKEGRAEVSDFAQNIGRVTQIGRTLGVTFDQVAAATAGLTNVGLPAHQAVTALLGILNQIISPSKEAEEILKGVGTSIQELQNNIREKGLLVALQDMLKLFGNNQNALEALFPEVRGFSGALALLRDNGNENARILRNVANSAGIVDEAFRNTKDNVSVLWGVLKNQLTLLMIQIGQSVLPVVTQALKDLNAWFARNRETIGTLMGTGLRVLSAVVFGTAKSILLLVEGISEMFKQFVKLSGAIPILGPILSLIKQISGVSPAAAVGIATMGAAFAWALPGGPVIVGLLAIVTALGYLDKKGQGIADKISGALGLPTSTSGTDKIHQAFIDGARTLEEAIRRAFDNAELSGSVIKQIQQQRSDINLQGGIDQFYKLTESATKAGDSSELLDNALKKIAPSFDNTALASDKLQDKLKELAQEFEKSSEAASHVESLTAKLGLFGNFTKELADSLNFSAGQSGLIQGAQAVAAAEQRAAEKAFYFTQALAAVAQAFQQNARVAQNIVLQMARSALDAARAAAQAVFARPTREVANLNVQLAGARVSSAATAASTNPQITALQHQLANINKQISAQQKINQRQLQAQKDSSSAIRDAANRISSGIRAQLEALKEANQRAEDNGRAQLEAMRFRNLQAQLQAEANQDRLERLIDATKERASTLQAQFLEANEALQRQINEAIGKGDSATALGLVNQQQAAAKAYQAEAKALVKQEQALTKEQKQAELAESARARAAQLEEATAEMQFNQAQRVRSAQERALEAQLRAVEATEQASQAQNEQTEATNRGTEALEAQKDKIQEQIDALTAQNQLSSEQEARIQEQIDLYQAESDLLQRQIEAADQTLLTQEEQRNKALELIRIVGEESGVIRELSRITGEDLIPEMDLAREQFFLMKDMVRVLTDEGFRGKLMEQGIDPVTELFKIMAIAQGEVIGSQKKVVESQSELAEQAKREADNINLFQNTYGGVITSIIEMDKKGAETQEKALEESSNKIKQAGEGAGESIESSGREITEGGHILFQAIWGAAQLINSLGSKILGMISSAGTSVINAITSAAGSAASAISKAASSAASGIAGAVSSAAKAAGNATGIKSSGAPKPISQNQGPQPAYKSSGGIVDKPLLTWVGETFQKEAIIPLERPARARQILGSLPPGILKQIWPATVEKGIFTGPVGMPLRTSIPPSIMSDLLNKRSVSSVFAPNIVVTGETLDSMERAAMRAVQSAFRDARTTSIRRGGLISQGIGPGM